MQLGRPGDRLNSTMPIYSRVIPLSNPSRELKYEHLRKDLKNCTVDHLATRLMDEIEEHDKLKHTMIRMEGRCAELEGQLSTLVSTLESRNTDQLKLMAIQQRYSDKIKRLQREIESKAASANSYWQNRYQQLNKYLVIYSEEIAQMQQEFRSQHSILNQKLDEAEKSLGQEMRLREDLAERLTSHREKLERADSDIATLTAQRNELETGLTDLEGENTRLLHNSKAYSDELQKCTDLTDKLFTQVREKGLQLKEKNETIVYLQKHLNTSVEEIQRLNELLRSSIDSDNKAMHEIQRLDLKVSESKAQLQSARHQIQQKQRRILQLESEIKSLLQTTDVLKQLARDLQLKLVTTLANQQHQKSQLDTKQDKIENLQQELARLRKDQQQGYSQYERQLKRLSAVVEENSALYRKELEINTALLQQLDRHKKQGGRKNMVLSSMKDKNRQDKGREFKLNDFQQKLDRYSAARPVEGDADQYGRGRNDRDRSPEGLRRIVEEISLKVNELAEAQSHSALRQSRQLQDRMYERQQPSPEAQLQ